MKPRFDTFKPAYLPLPTVEQIMAEAKCSVQEATVTLVQLSRARVFMNSIYQVNIRDDYPHGFGFNRKMVHLSIKRIDKEPIHDWRHLQRIKNELVGPECEAVELYPAESRLVDEANQFHLFAFVDADVRFPFGAVERIVRGPEPGSNAKQRPFEAPGEPS